MRIAGYKLNAYNATYEKTDFDVRTGYNTDNNRVLEVTDIYTGVTFIFEYGENKGYVRKSHKPKK